MRPPLKSAADETDAMPMIKRAIGGLAAAGVAVFGGVSAMGDETTRNEDGVIIEAGGLGAFAMRVGDCFNIPDSSLVASVEALPCGDPHDAEVFAVFDVDGGSQYPGDAAVEDDAGLGCYKRYEGYVGQAYETSEFGLSWFSPTRESWQELNDREIVCYLGDLNGLELDESMRGSGR